MTDKTASKGASVLASLTASVMEEKVAASRPKLTPVAGEAGPPATRLPDVPGDFLTDEGIADVATGLRGYADYLNKVADGLDKMRGVEPSAAPVDLAQMRKQKERAADAKAAANPTVFETALAEKAAAAQAATFDRVKVAVNTEPVKPIAIAPVPDGGWTCPTHGRAIEKTSATTGRVYRGCPDCNLFERR